MQIKKYCELHVHLEGCVWNKHIKAWWDKSKYLFPPISYYNINAFNSFDKFLAQLRFNYNFLNGIEQYTSVLNDYVLNMIKSNIYYSEVQINLALLNAYKIDIKGSSDF